MLSPWVPEGPLCLDRRSSCLLPDAHDTATPPQNYAYCMLSAFQDHGRAIYRVRPSELAMLKIKTDGTLTLLQETTFVTQSRGKTPKLINPMTNFGRSGPDSVSPCFALGAALDTILV
jgi:hypothetical protein